MNDATNPETGVTDVESAVQSLLVPDAGQDEDKETEPAQEPEIEAEAEDAPEADDAEAEASDTDVEADGESDEADEEADDDPLYTITVDGEEYEVNLSELRNGYQRQSDYTKKTSTLAEERRAIQAQAQQVDQLRGQLEAAMAKFAQGDGEPEPDWEALAADPWEYTRTKASWEKKTAERAQAQQRLAAVQQERQAAQIAQEMGKLKRHFPEWEGEAGRARMEADREALRKTAHQYGFSDQEFFGAVDHRAFLLLRDAMRGRSLNASAKTLPTAKKVAKKPVAALKPGAKATTAEKAAQGRDALRNKLKRRGDDASAVEWLLSGE